VRRPPPATGTPGGPSFVALGDSIAAGEGTYYGYTYDDRPILPTWNGPTDANPTWDGQYKECHDSRFAYNQVVARRVGARLTTFACTGAAYDNGIAVPEVQGTITYRPAEFGNWGGQTDLNPDYDAAEPDVVTVTFGADDVDFVGIVRYCLLAAYGISNRLDARIAGADNPDAVIEERLDDVLENLAHSVENELDPGAGRVSEPYCTAAKPGLYIQQNFLDREDELRADHYALALGILARGAEAGRVPAVVFTTYHDPLPSAESDISFLDCPDALTLYRDQLDYLHELLARMSTIITESVAGIDGVAVADIDDVMNGHEFCTSDPWAYGPSILLENPDSPAPFHPTPAGQKAIADVVYDALPAQYRR
jgi:hypothetical protein